MTLCTGLLASFWAILLGTPVSVQGQACERPRPPVIETDPYRFEGELCLSEARLTELGVARLRVRYAYGAFFGEPIERFALAWDAARDGAELHSVRFRGEVVRRNGQSTGLFAVFSPDTIGRPGGEFGMSMSGSPNWNAVFVDSQGTAVSEERAKAAFRAGFSLRNLEVVHISTNAGSDGDASSNGSAGESSGSGTDQERTAPECRSDGDCGAGRTCANGVCVGNGQLRFTLTWSQPGDMDLHVVTPGGSHLYYGSRSGDGGELDRDDTRGTGPENVFWEGAPPAGEYLVCVVPYGIWQATAFTLAVQTPDGREQRFAGTRGSSNTNGECTRTSPTFVTAVRVGGAQPNVAAGDQCRTDADCGAARACSNGYCVGNGQLRFTLTWDQPGDMDLHVMTPDSTHLYYGSRRGAGGELDRDDTRGTGPENVFWTESPPVGDYRICVVPYSIRQSTQFTLVVQTPDGATRSYSGIRAPGGRGDCEAGSATFVTAVRVGR